MEEMKEKPDNIQLITKLNRLLLKAVYRAIKEAPPEDMDEQAAITKKYAQLFGAKQSLAGVLGEVADTELKIEKQRPKRAVQEEADIPLEEADIRLIKEFVKQQTIPSPLEGEG